VSEADLPFDEATAEMKTGDIVLMHGTFPASKLIQWIEGSKWTHSGVIVRPEDVGAEGTDVLFWESNSTPLPDVRFGTTKPGPMLGTLRARVDDAVKETYDMEFAWHRLEAERSAEVYERIWNFMPTVHEASFPSDLQMAAFWFLGRFFRDRTPDDKIFCAELVAMTYQAAGWMDPSLIPNRFDPKDFSSKGSVPLLGGAKLTQQRNFAPPVHH
jgi:hypothetical protein